MEQDEQKAAKRAAMKRATLRLIIGVALLDVAAMAVWYLAGVSQMEPKIRLYFTVVWTVATAVVVSFLLKKVRQARFSSMSRR